MNSIKNSILIGTGGFIAGAVTVGIVSKVRIDNALMEGKNLEDKYNKKNEAWENMKNQRQETIQQLDKQIESKKEEMEKTKQLHELIQKGIKEGNGNENENVIFICKLFETLRNEVNHNREIEEMQQTLKKIHNISIKTAAQTEAIQDQVKQANSGMIKMNL